MTTPNPGLSPEIASFFQDPDASSAVVMAAQQIAAPVVQGATLTADETMMGGGVRVVFFILDASPSMGPVANALRNGFNNDFVPAVQAAREDDISALRIGGVAFSSGPPKPIWKGANGTTSTPSTSSRSSPWPTTTRTVVGGPICTVPSRTGPRRRFATPVSSSSRRGNDES